MTQHVVHLQAWGRSHSPHKFMIVSAAFTGDDNDELAMAQFAAYPESVRLMLAVARRSIANSKDKQGLGIEWTMIGEDIDHRPFDHRVLQGAHDLVAGYFR